MVLPTPTKSLDSWTRRLRPGSEQPRFRETSPQHRTSPESGAWCNSARIPEQETHLITFLPPDNIFWIIADVLQVLVILIVVEVIVSWAVMFGSVSPYRPWVRTLRKITDPLLEPIRRLVPPHKMRGL